MAKTLLVLAGGDGSRLKEVTGNVSKPLVQFSDEPLLAKIIRKLTSELSVKYVHLLIQKKHKEQYVRFLSENVEFQRYRIALSLEETKLGTGGAIKFFLKTNKLDKFYVTNADTLIKSNINRFTIAKDNSILCTKIEKNSRFGCVEVDLDGKITSFWNANQSLNNVMVNTGVYKLTDNIFDEIVDDIFDIEKSLFPILAKKSQLNAFEMELDFEDIGIPEVYYKEVKKYEQTS